MKPREITDAEFGVQTQKTWPLKKPPPEGLSEWIPAWAKDSLRPQHPSLQEWESSEVLFSFKETQSIDMGKQNSQTNRPKKKKKYTPNPQPIHCWEKLFH